MSRTNLMQAVIYHGPKDLRLEWVERPTPAAGEMVIKVEAALTCGTDFKAYRQGHPVLLNHRLPSPFGHEVSGRVFEKGEGVKKFEIGQSVVVANSAPCDQCYFCRHDNPNLCENLFLLNGAYAQFLLVPKQIVKHNVHPLRKTTPFKAAAMTEPLACVVRATSEMNLRKKQTLIILGCGYMGLLFTQLAKAAGATVIAIGRSTEKLEQAKSLGADHVLSVLNDKDYLKAALALTPEGRGADAVVEAVGQPETWQEALKLVRKGGQICLYGGCKKGLSFEIDCHRMHYEELKIFGVFHHTPKHFRKALGFIENGVIDTDFLIRGSVRLADLPQYYADQVDKPFHKTLVEIS